MLTEIVKLSNTSQLVQSLHLSSISVLLFTAVWSIESEFAREALQNAIPLTPSSCHPSIRLYELSWPPPYPMLTPTPQRRHPKVTALTKSLSNRFPEALRQLNAMLTTSDTLVFNDELVHFNLTNANSVPWLPCIQIFLNHSQHVTPFVYQDSFDHVSLASFLQNSCAVISSSFTSQTPQQEQQEREREQQQHPDKQPPGQLDNADSSIRNSSSSSSSNSSFDYERSKNQSNTQESTSTHSLAPSPSHSLPTPTTSVRQVVMPVSRDRFANLISDAHHNYRNQQYNDNNALDLRLCGLLITLTGGSPSLFENYMPIWNALVASVRHHPSAILTELTTADPDANNINNHLNINFAQTNASSISDGSSGTPTTSWIMSIIDSQTDTNLIHALESNFNADERSLSHDLSMIVIDPLSQKDIQVIHCGMQLQNCSSSQWLSRSLHRYCDEIDSSENKQKTTASDNDLNSDLLNSIIHRSSHSSSTASPRLYHYRRRPGVERFRLLSYIQKPQSLFDHASTYTDSSSSNIINGKALLNRHFRRHAKKRQQLQQQTFVSLQSWLNYNYDTRQQKPLLLWVVVYQTWCAFSQRLLSLYNRFAKLVQTVDMEIDVDVDVLFIEDCSELPNWIDHLVDGFPTILLLRQWHHWSSVIEYREPHQLSQLVDFHHRHASDLVVRF